MGLKRNINKWFGDGQRKMRPAYLYAGYEDEAGNIVEKFYDLGCVVCQQKGRDLFVYTDLGVLIMQGVTIHNGGFDAEKSSNCITIKDCARRYCIAAFDPYGWDAFRLELWATYEETGTEED